MVPPAKMAETVAVRHAPSSSYCLAAPKRRPMEMLLKMSLDIKCREMAWVQNRLERQ